MEGRCALNTHNVPVKAAGLVNTADEDLSQPRLFEGVR